MSYFYTDTIKALWMVKHHGLELMCEEYDTDFLGYGTGLIEDCADIEDFLNLVGTLDALRVNPHSLNLLRPQEGDLGIYNNQLVRRENGSWWAYHGHWKPNEARPPVFMGNDIEVEVIKRNGKLFFEPETDICSAV